MVFTRILGRVGRVFGCLRRKRKNLRDSLKSRDRDVAANETLSDSDSLSVYSVYLVDSVSEVSEDGQSVAFDDCWSYSESVELVRHRIILLLSLLTHLYYNNMLIRLLHMLNHCHSLSISQISVAQHRRVVDWSRLYRHWLHGFGVPVCGFWQRVLRLGRRAGILRIVQRFWRAHFVCHLICSFDIDAFDLTDPYTSVMPNRPAL